MTPTPNTPNTPNASNTPPVKPNYRAQLAQWNVVLVGDPNHSYNYMTTLLREVFKAPVNQAVELATAITRSGRAVCMTTHKEHAEFKRDQILAFGKDYLVEGCPGPMSALIEAA